MEEIIAGLLGIIALIGFFLFAILIAVVSAWPLWLGLFLIKLIFFMH